MIYILPASDVQKHADLATGMFRLRHRVFAERLAWVEASDDGLERDRFDEFNPIYLISTSEFGQVNGSWRLLPTMGPYMLREVFSDLLEGQVAPCEPGVWETSRFVVGDAGATKGDLRAIARTTVELFCALGEFCESRGLAQIVTVHDIRIARLIHRVVGYAPEWESSPVKMKNSKVLAARYRVEPGILRMVRKKFGIEGSVVRNWADKQEKEAA